MQRHFDNGQCNKIVFEITESIAAEDIEVVISVINKLKKLGIRFSMDDFGTGYSSLAYLSRLPLDEIKIDRSFVNSLDQNEHSKTMVITIINMAKIFNLKIVAEGVETIDQLDFLLNNNTNIFQGYLYSKALTKEQFRSYYRDSIQ